MITHTQKIIIIKTLCEKHKKENVNVCMICMIKCFAYASDYPNGHINIKVKKINLSIKMLHIIIKKKQNK